MINKINSKTNWNEFMQINPGIIEYIDCDEQVFAMISPLVDDVYKAKNTMKKSKELVKKNNYVNVSNRYNELTFSTYSHCEIHPSLLVGSVASTIPFCNNNNGARTILHYAQGKQAMGIYASNYRYRLDAGYILYHPQKPLIDTRTSKYTYYDILSPGENAVIAIMDYTGFNQEDSIIMNQSAIDRGLFRITAFEKYIEKISKNQSTSMDDKFVKPDPSKVSGMNNGNYNKLNNLGYIPEETIIENNDILIGKVSSIQTNEKNLKPYKDKSIIYKSYDTGIIDKVYNNIYDADGYEIKKIKIRSEKAPIIGDKFSTKCAQKATIGLILPSSDMPYTENGITPDIIFNLNSIYGRMTMGFMLELLFGKACAIKGVEYDATAFTEVDPNMAKNILKSMGYEENGMEYMYNGMTGEKIKCAIFIGPMYYLRLKHMVSDKIHARPTGPKSMLLRQPCEGRARGGGLKIGEMERDCLISHGMSKYTKEKLLDVSDSYDAYVCDKCGLFAQRFRTPNNKIIPSSKDIYYCQACDNKTSISKVTIPYAFKLLVQELQAMSINPKIHIKSDNIDNMDNNDV
jgi:DNA-directed RNA polymerase II subunit RPB2